MTLKHTLADHYFDDIYSANDDPWNFTESQYEAQKYTTTLNALPSTHYDNAFEIGCSIGVFTEKLAAKCARLLAVDVSDKALAQAKKRCSYLPQVRFQKMNVPQAFPLEKFDLIVISEVGYFFTAEDWQFTIEKAYLQLKNQGQIALVHWLPVVHDFPQTGDEVHDAFAQLITGKMLNRHKAENQHYRIDIWEKY